MAVQVVCPHCTKSCLVEDQHRGMPVRCYACSRVFTVPTPPSEDDFPTPTFDVDPPQAAATGLQLDVGAATSAGKVRPNNEDGYLVLRQTWNWQNRGDELLLLAVADGMGGHVGGERACGLTLQTLHRSLAPLFDEATGSDWKQNPKEILAQRLRMAFHDASRAVCRAAQSDPACKGMGAAAVVALIWQRTAYVGHVGDCRAYHFHAGTLTQLTKDQTLVQRMLDLGTLKEHEARNHPAKNELTQAIGRRPDVEPGFVVAALAKDDWLLLASDGLHTHVEATALGRELEMALPSAVFLAQHLLEVVNGRGGTDNCTVAAVYCG